MSVERLGTPLLDRDDVDLDSASWALALGLFGLGDLATTAWGFRLGYAEANPFLVLALGDVAIETLVVAKTLGFVFAWGVWKKTSRRTWVVPGTLAFSGAVIVGWNLGVIVS